MRTTNTLTRLYDYQARVLAQIDEATALLKLDPLVARAPLAKARWTMTRLLREYQLFKHREIFDPVIAGGEERLAETARRLRASCIAAGEHFAAHVAHWSAADVAAQWDGYCPATRRMAGQLRSHIARERSQVEVLLRGWQSTRPIAHLPRGDGAADRPARLDRQAPGNAPPDAGARAAAADAGRRRCD